MKKFIFVFALVMIIAPIFASAAVIKAATPLALTNAVEVSDVEAQAGWISLKRICFSNSAYDSRMARESCEDAAETINLLATEQMVFNVVCSPATYTDTCSYGGSHGSILTAKALAIPSR